MKTLLTDRRAEVTVLNPVISIKAEGDQIHLNVVTVL